MLFYDYFHYEKFPNIPVSLVSELHNYNTRTALQAHFFKKSPFGDLKLQNGRQKKIIINVISRGGHFVYVT